MRKEDIRIMPTAPNESVRSRVEKFISDTAQLAEIYNLIEKGNPAKVFEDLKDFFALPALKKLSYDELHFLYINLYIEIVARCKGKIKVERLKKIAEMAVCIDLEYMKKAISEEAAAVASENLPEISGGYSALIKETLHIINNNISNESLSLRWIAGNIIYTNVDYLGKTFKKETGTNFSYYVMERRMEYAKQLLDMGNIDKIYEIAEKVGYGSNSQYFSQVFKKYTGISPIEYRERAKKNKKAAE